MQKKSRKYTAPSQLQGKQNRNQHQIGQSNHCLPQHLCFPVDNRADNLIISPAEPKYGRPFDVIYRRKQTP